MQNAVFQRVKDGILYCNDIVIVYYDLCVLPCLAHKNVR